MAENPDAPIGRVTLDGDRFIREMNAALAKYERDMAFTAPELWSMRMKQLRERLSDLIYQADEDDEDWAGEVEAYVNDDTRRLDPFSVRETELEERAGDE